MKKIQEHLTSAWKTIESDTEKTDTARKETKDETKEECLAATVSTKTEGKLLVFLRVNCRSIYNKTLDLWNLIDTYKPDVVIDMESWLRGEISNAEDFGPIIHVKLSEETDTLAVVECLCKKLHYWHGTMV